MNELERIVTEAGRLREERLPFLLATVVRVAGSSYRRPGARMLLTADRWIAGSVSGGCLERDVMMRGAHYCRCGPTVVTYDSTDEGEPWSTALGCNGVVDVLLEHVDAGAEHPALAFARACFEAEAAGSLATVIRSSRPTLPVGACVAAGPGSDRIPAVADLSMRALLEEAVRGAPGVVELADAGVTVLVERIAPSPQLFVLGSGYDAVPIVATARSVGMRVTVADRSIRERSLLRAADRIVTIDGGAPQIRHLIDAAADAYVVIKHHQRAADREALAAALASRAIYVGVMGPARRTRELLGEIGTTATADPRIHAPIGLDIGAETPEQIALAIVAEIQAVQRRRRGGMLRRRARGLHAELAIAVLAAGASRRLGRPKQLVEIEGAPLVRRVAGTCMAAHAGPVAVVLGAHAAPVASALTGLPVTLVPNHGWDEGVASSIRAAVSWARTTSADALGIVLADQPRLSVEHLGSLRDAWLAGADLVGSRFAGVVGAPAVFDRSRWSELAELQGDAGAARLLRAAGAAAVDWPDGTFDVDTAGDLALLSASSEAMALFARPS